MSRLNTYTTATTAASDDWLVIDGATNSTRKLSAATPAFLTSVTVPTIATAAGVNLALNVGTAASDKVLLNGTLDATAADGTSASIGTLGGASVKKALWVGGLANIAGNVTLSGATASATLGTATEVASLAVSATGAATLTNKSGQTMTFASGTGAYAFTGSGMTTFTGGVTVTGIQIASTDTISGAGAVSVTKDTTLVTSTGVGDALTLANGTAGQIKRIIHDVDGGTAVLTPATKTGYSTITFTNAGDAVTLEYVTTRGWIVTGSFGVTIA